MTKELQNALGLARKAGKIVYGATVMDAVRHKQCSLVIIASDASARTTKQFSNKCDFYHVPYRIVENSAAISYSIGKFNIMTLAITDSHIAQMVLEIIDRNEVN